MLHLLGRLYVSSVLGGFERTSKVLLWAIKRFKGGEDYLIMLTLLLHAMLRASAEFARTIDAVEAGGTCAVMYRDSKPPPADVMIN